MPTNQERVHTAVRARSGTARSYDADWLAMMANDGFATGTFNERQLGWLNAELVADGDASAPYSSIVEAQTAYAVRQSFKRWTDMTTLL